MKRNEVKVWINYHQELFPDWKYLSTEKTASRALAFEACVKAFIRTDLEDASEASDRMLAGNVKRPYRDEDVVAAIVLEASNVKCQRFAQSQPQPKYGQQTYDCPYCEGTGWVECWRRNLRDTYVCVCTCKLGDKHSAGVVDRYNPQVNYRLGDESEHWLRTRERIESGMREF